ncbi:MAG: hypothetical protein M1820_006201 [Bogoriella megaspora]|nr:MAG: hypothetical protein M1820_006201 [Bogoriella megaspora]
MKAIGVAQYGAISNLEARILPQPDKLKGRDLLIEVKAMSVNPIDTKVRNGTYDDAPGANLDLLLDYYDHVPESFHVVGFDGAGIVRDVGPDCKYFKPGDAVFYVGSATRQGSAAEYQLVDERTVGHKPSNFDFVESAVMPLTYGTAYEAVVERLGIQKNEQAAILIINGAGGVGSMASQIARYILNLPVVITTASRPETTEWTKKMGATHVLDHRKDLRPQIEALTLDIPLKYIFITHSTSQYLSVSADICAPLGKICSIVQSPVNFYGTQFLSKSITFAWCWLGSRSYHNYDRDAQHLMMEELAAHCESGEIRSHLTKRMKLTKEGLQQAHRLMESTTTIGKIGLGIEEDGAGKAFA